MLTEIDAGQYRKFTIKHLEIKETRTKRTPYLQVTLEDEFGNIILDNLTVFNKAIPFSLRRIEWYELDGLLSKNITDDDLPKHIIGKVIEAKIKKEIYQNRTYYSIV